MYLSDSSGRHVTPMVLTNGPRDPLPLNAGIKSKILYHSAHGNVTVEQKTKALEASFRMHQRANASFRPVNVSTDDEEEQDRDEDGDEDEDEDIGEDIGEDMEIGN